MSSVVSQGPSNFARLPSELLQLIFDYLTPPQLFPSQYQERQAIFRQLSLVNRQFSRLAKWYLLHVVKLSTVGYRSTSGVDSILRKLRKGDLGSANKVKVLICEDLEYKHKSGIEGVKGLRDNLEELWYRGSSKSHWHHWIPPSNDLSFFCLIPFFGLGLKRLHLRNVQIRDNAPFDLPLLEQLSLCIIDLPPQAKFVYNLPALRHLSTESLGRGGNYFRDALMPQLASYTIPLYDRFFAPESIRKNATPCLVRSNIEDLSGNCFEQQKLEISDLRLEDVDSGCLNTWSEMFRALQAPVTLRHIFMSRKEAKSWTRSSVDEFERVCQSQGIEVVDEEMGGHAGEGARFSQEFIRRVEAGMA